MKAIFEKKIQRIADTYFIILNYYIVYNKYNELLLQYIITLIIINNLTIDIVVGLCAYFFSLV